MTTILCAAAVLAAQPAAPRWEQVTVSTDTIEFRGEGNETIDVTTRDGYIYITTRDQISVKLFTILGQLIIQDTLPAGVHRYRLTSRGIYLLKAGNLTRRITV
ncbi:MAG: hypothetical protein NC336_10415 [Clostridium sp.]|nr:hypothetical protein [Clostridium sp.]